jgi:hypothetical protein
MAERIEALMSSEITNWSTTTRQKEQAATTS